MTASKKYFALLLFVALAGYAIVAFAGAPLKGCDVKLGRNPGGSPAARTTTDDQGKFTFDNLPEGKYDLFVSYEQCAKMAINTKGTGATLRGASPEFEVELLPSEGISFAKGPRQTTSLDGTRSTPTNGVPVNGVPTNGVPLRVALTSQSPATSPIATITVAAKHKELTGHVTLIK